MEGVGRGKSRARARAVKVDIDIPFEQFQVWLYPLYDKAVRVIARELFNVEVVDVVCRESNSGRTHCWIHLDREVDEFTVLLMSFFFYDDHNRFNWNHSRFVSFGRTFSILFSKKEKVVLGEEGWG